MLDKMLDLVKGEVAKKVGGIDGVPAGKKSAVVETTASSLMDGLKKFATPDKLASLIGGGGGGSATSGLTKGVVSALTSKLGLSPAVAKTIATKVVPAVMSLLKKNVDDPSNPGFDLSSMLGALGGGSKGSGGGIMGALGGLFGKK